MDYILHIVLALLSVGAADVGLASGTPHPVLVATLVLVPHVLVHIARSAQYHGHFRLAVLLERLLVLSPFALQALAVTRFNWLGSLADWTGTRPSLSSWPGLELLLGIAPFVAYQLAALHARTLLRDPRRSDRRALFFFQARMLLSALAPFAIYVGLSAALGARDEVRVRLEEVSLYFTLFTLVLLGVFLGFLPYLLKSTWSTSQIPSGDLRGLLEDVARKSGFEYRELLQWNTGGQMANAALVGFTRRTRVVLFTDALIAQLHPRELAAVFAHEIGHARRHHARTFLFFVVIVFVGAQIVLDLAAVENEWILLAVTGVLLLVWLFGFGFLSRRLELEADLSSLEVLGDPLPLASALMRVTDVRRHERDGWRHFSTGRRVRFLVAAAQNPALGQRLRKMLRRWSSIAAAVALGLVLFWCMRLLQMRPEEELIADLRLGQWQRAVARSEAGMEVDEDVRKLILRARDLDDGIGSEALEASALQAVVEQDLVAARELLELAGLRGADRVWDRLDVLDELLAAPADRKLSRDELAQLRSQLSADWAQALTDLEAQLDAQPRPGAILRR